MHKFVISTISLFLLFSLKYVRASEMSPLLEVQPSSASTGPLLVGYTHQRTDGNRLVEGQGDFPNSRVIDIKLDGTPEWVVAVPKGDASLWAVVYRDGRVQAFCVDSQGAEPFHISPKQLEPGQPPVLKINMNNASLIAVLGVNPSKTTHPIPLSNSETLAFVHNNGSLALSDQSGNIQKSFPINSLPDGRILSDHADRLLVLTGPTDAYTHGVLGDQIEATSITQIATSGEAESVHSFSVPEGQVIEGVAPIWADWNGDGEREIVITLSDSIQGARLVVFNETGEIIGKSAAIGLGYRWRHQIAVAPFGPNGEMELVDVLTPHIGGVVEFFQWQGGQLEIVAQVSGYSSHRIGSRNLDMAVAGDFDGDGQVELLVPYQNYSELGGIRRTETGAEVVYNIPAGGIISTNIGAVQLLNGKIAVGVGSENKLRIWYPSNFSQ